MVERRRSGAAQREHQSDWTDAPLPRSKRRSGVSLIAKQRLSGIAQPRSHYQVSGSVAGRLSQSGRGGASTQEEGTTNLYFDSGTISKAQTILSNCPASVVQ